jgi:hypothetical protein
LYSGGTRKMSASNGISTVASSFRRYSLVNRRLRRGLPGPVLPPGQPPGTRTRRHAALLCLLLSGCFLPLFSSPHNNLDSRNWARRRNKESVMQCHGLGDGAPPVAAFPSSSSWGPDHRWKEI